MIKFREHLYFKVLNSSDFSTLRRGEPTVDCQNCKTYPVDVKCCTYEPFIPNFLVGAWVKYQMLERDQFNARLFQPMGRFPNFKTKNILKDNPSLFGAKEAPVCKFYKEQKCTVWPFNGSRCMTYFCRSQDSQVGLKKWESIYTKCADREFEIAQECMIYAGIPSALLDQQLLLFQSDSEDYLLDNWEKYFGGSREEFYIYCYEKARELLGS